MTKIAWLLRRNPNTNNVNVNGDKYDDNDGDHNADNDNDDLIFSARNNMYENIANETEYKAC